VGTIFLYKQIVLTREAVEDTGLATEAMNESNHIAREVMESQIRPWLKIEMKDSCRLDVVNGHPVFIIKATIKNIGATPARKVYVNFYISIGVEPDKMTYSKVRFQNFDEVLSASDDIFPGDFEEKEWNLQISPPPNAKAKCFVVGMAVYRTPFSSQIRATARFFELIDAEAIGGIIDFSAPVSSKRLEFSTFRKTAGFID
jgi:hypothetical protein